MFNKRRSEIQIIEDILKLSKNGAKKTQILHQGNMSYSQLQTYLSFLIENKIIIETENNKGEGSNYKTYFTTDKGNDLLKEITNLYSYFE